MGTTLVYTQLGSSGSDGPLVGGLSGIAAAALAATDPAGLVPYVNAALLAAETNLPEGTRVEMEISGWATPLGSSAQLVASTLQSAYQQGRIVDPESGQPPEAWPEYPGQIFWGDDATDTLTVRALKAQPPVVAIWIVVGLLALVAAVLVWDALHASTWRASSASAAVAKAAVGVLSWAVGHWYLVLGGAAVLAVAPWALREHAALRAAEAQEIDASRSLRRARSEP